MALTAKSLLLYNFQVTSDNRSIDFKSSLLGSEKQATLRLGSYSLSGLMAEVSRAMQEAEPNFEYTVTANRTFNGGTENRVTITTDGTYLDLLFASGTRTTSTAAPLIGFNIVDYTGLTSYTGNSSAGVALIPDLVGYNYLGPNFLRKVFGAVNIAADGSKEAIVFQIQRFLEVQFKYEPQTKADTEWADFFDWGIQQKAFEFTPEISSPTTFYEVTLESTSDDSKALGYRMREMLPQFPFFYDTGLMKMRQIVPPVS